VQVFAIRSAPVRLFTQALITVSVYAAPLALNTKNVTSAMLHPDKITRFIANCRDGLLRACPKIGMTLLRTRLASMTDSSAGIGLHT